MSVPPNTGPEPTAGGMLGPANSVMSAIFDLAEDPDAAPAAEPGTEAAPEAGAEPPAAAGGDTPPAVPGAPEEEPPADGAEAGAGAAAVQPAQPVVTADDRVVAEQFGKMGEALEERFNDSFEQQAVEQAQKDYPQYISMLQLHPLELVGKELPSIDGSDDTVVFRTAAEIKEWQEAVQMILQRELEASVAQRRQDSNEVLDVVHASIQMFQDNPDLVPGSKSYNKALAVQFIKTAEPYALRMNGKLTGYSIPVQGLIDQVRAQVKAAAPAAAAAPAKKAAAPGAKPQAGIASKAGAGGGEGEDFAPMWKALGIDSVPI